VALRLGDRSLRPVAGVDVVRRAAGRQQVERHRGVLALRAALQEQHLVMRGDAQQRAQVAFRFLGDRHEVGAAMAHFHDGHAGAVPVEQLLLRALEHRLGHRRRARG
jgi:hypothetical protein